MKVSFTIWWSYKFRIKLKKRAEGKFNCITGNEHKRPQTTSKQPQTTTNHHQKYHNKNKTKQNFFEIQLFRFQLNSKTKALKKIGNNNKSTKYCVLAYFNQHLISIPQKIKGGFLKSLPYSLILGVDKFISRNRTFRACNFTCAPNRARKKWMVKSKVYVRSRNSKKHCFFSL